MPPVRAWLSVAGNIEPETNIAAALERLARQVRIAGVSTFYVTPAIDRPEQPDYWNGVVMVDTELSPRILKYNVLRAIESELGRVRTEDAYAARTIDLDILLYGGWVCDEPGLRIPDPDLRTRTFLAAALLELTPDLVMPDTGAPLAALLEPRAASRLIAAAAFTKRMKEYWNP
jgi:2-amino-4-hydroxy-6-hydroxymethyldihydropteridine diphosphokinase